MEGSLKGSARRQKFSEQPLSSFNRNSMSKRSQPITGHVNNHAVCMGVLDYFKTHKEQPRTEICQYIVKTRVEELVQLDRRQL